MKLYHASLRQRRVDPFTIASQLAVRLLSVTILSFCLACGDDSRANAAGDPNKQLEEIESQLKTLEQQASGLRRDVQSRLVEIEATRKALTAEVKDLKTVLAGGTAAPANPAAATAPADGAPQVGDAASPADSAVAADALPAVSEHKSNFGLRIILLLVIIVAIAFILRIFLGRWGSEEEPRELLEKKNELGVVRYPASEDENVEDEIDVNVGTETHEPDRASDESVAHSSTIGSTESEKES